MKTVSRGRYALSICAAATVLAGCGGATQFPNPGVPTPLGNASNHPDFGSVNAERLRARGVKGECGGDGTSWGCHFHARGRAVGPYPGTFFAHCQSTWSKFSLKTWWTFQEHFIIRSGSSKIDGTIEVNGTGGMFIPLPGVYQYTTTTGYSGNVKIESLGQFLGPDADFREIFDGM
jgi:hypothetical protein